MGEKTRARKMAAPCQVSSRWSLPPKLLFLSEMGGFRPNQANASVTDDFSEKALLSTENTSPSSG